MDWAAARHWWPRITWGPATDRWWRSSKGVKRRIRTGRARRRWMPTARWSPSGWISGRRMKRLRNEECGSDRAETDFAARGGDGGEGWRNGIAGVEPRRDHAVGARPRPTERDR